MNIDANIKNADWPKRTPDKFSDLVQKFEEAKHRRDKQGRFADQASVTIGDRQIAVVKPRRAAMAGDVMVPLDVVRFDEEFQREQGFYLGVGGQGGIGTRYARFGTFIGEHDSIEAPEVTVQASGRVGFTDGRHRYAWLRDQGITSIPVSMTPESAKYAKKYGLLAAVKKAWDESQHPRDKEGQFTETVYHGTGQDFPTFDLARGGEATGAKNGVLGAFFTTDVVKAGDLYAGRRGTLMEARLKLTNPARFRGQEYENDASATVNSETAAYVEKPLDDLTEDDFREWRDFLIRQGHDGIEVRLHHGETDYIVFNVAQIVRTKQEHAFGNTQILIAPTSSAAQSLNMAREAIQEDHLMATGKDVDPNHVTVRFGLLNEDLDHLRSFIARQVPFEAHVDGVELFPASEHSDGAVPVVARIACPELRAIEKQIGDYADFKEKSFPVYKPHCTLAYL